MEQPCVVDGCDTLTAFFLPLFFLHKQAQFHFIYILFLRFNSFETQMDFMDLDHKNYLRRCFELARIPGAAVEPNPRVGAIVVHNGEIIGEGYHESFGGPHAEVNAIRSVRNTTLLAESTVYVSLEPCNHHGKTPPCTNLILENRIPNVVIGAVDSNPQMAGKSIDFLRNSGVNVVLFDNLNEFEQLNSHFNLNQVKKRACITLKWAESSDGFIAGKNSNGQIIQTAISGAESNRFVHHLRHENQAILVGQQTALIDQPSLTTRNWPGRSPIRIVIDDQLRLPQTNPLLSGQGSIILNSVKEGIESGNTYVKYNAPLDWEHLLRRLYSEFQIGSILVEGGKFLHDSLISANVWDECIRIIGKCELAEGLSAPQIPNNSKLVESVSIGNDLIERYSPA